jgi:hypothetical protein
MAFFAVINTGEAQLDSTMNVFQIDFEERNCKFAWTFSRTRWRAVPRFQSILDSKRRKNE